MSGTRQLVLFINTVTYFKNYFALGRHLLASGVKKASSTSNSATSELEARVTNFHIYLNIEMHPNFASGK